MHKDRHFVRQLHILRSGIYDAMSYNKYWMFRYIKMNEVSSPAAIIAGECIVTKNRLTQEPCDLPVQR